MPSKKASSEQESGPRPTDAELALLRVLWKRQPATVREVMDAINEERDVPLAYTTVLKFLQIMTEKALVIRDDSDKAHLYRAAAPPERTKRQMVGDLLERLFDGSVGDLVLQALGNHSVSREEAAQIRKILKQLEEPK